MINIFEPKTLGLYLATNSFSLQMKAMEHLSRGQQNNTLDHFKLNIVVNVMLYKKKMISLQ